MSIFSRPGAVFWPRPKTLDIYLGRKENNNFTLEINLWEEKSLSDLQSVSDFLKQNRINQCSILIPDDVVHIKSFIYDTKITSIDKKEVINLASSSVDFEINPDFFTFTLIQRPDKTIIHTLIYEPSKIAAFNANISRLGITVQKVSPVSAAVGRIISQLCSDDFFALYPLDDNQTVLFLCQQNQVYLSHVVKGPNSRVQKILNYSQLYFANPSKKLYSLSRLPADLVAAPDFSRTVLDEVELNQQYRQPLNLPLPVTSLLSAIIKPMEVSLSSPSSPPPKKNIFPVIAAFLITAIIASAGIWFFFNRQVTTDEVPLEPSAATPTEAVTPTSPPPTPTLADAKLNPKLKIQVLNATDINGQAATLKSDIAKLGFTNIAVGNNAEKLTANQIQVKPSLSASVSAFFSEKLKSFPAEVSSTLKENGTYDIIFVIGTKLGTTPAIKPSPSASASTVSATPTR